MLIENLIESPFFSLAWAQSDLCVVFQVDIPLDPYLFETIASSGVEVDLLQKRQIHYFLKVLVALMPGILILWLIRESVMLMHVTSKRFLYKKYNQLFDMAYAENFILVKCYLGLHYLFR